MKKGKCTNQAGWHLNLCLGRRLMDFGLLDIVSEGLQMHNERETEVQCPDTSSSANVEDHVGF